MMAIVVLVLWLFTAGAGFSLLVSSNLGRSRPASATLAATASVSVASAATSAASASPAPLSSPTASSSPAAQAPAASKRELRRAARRQFDPPSLTAARQAPMVPALRSLLEFAHPALAITGLAFWLGFTLVHNRALGWIAFGLVTATICLGLTWFAANTRAARRGQNGRDQNGRDQDGRSQNGRDQDGRDRDEAAPSFGIRLVVLHGGGATVTFVLAALTALVLSH
jgi:hypothetical protein